MHLIVEIDGKKYEVELQRDENQNYIARIGGDEYRVDVCSIQKDIYHLLVDHLSFDVGLEPIEADTYRLHFYDRMIEARVWDAEREGEHVTTDQISGEVAIFAPMSGRIVAIPVEEDQRIESGTPLIVMEAMKMQNEIRAEYDARVVQINVKVGDTVRPGDKLLILRAE